MTDNLLVLDLDPRRFYGVESVSRISDHLSIAIASRAYLPEIEDLQRDWVASVAAPAFKLPRARRGAEARMGHTVAVLQSSLVEA
jgi:hypothetical protein